MPVAYGIQQVTYRNRGEPRTTQNLPPFSNVVCGTPTLCQESTGCQESRGEIERQGPPPQGHPDLGRGGGQQRAGQGTPPAETDQCRRGLGWAVFPEPGGQVAMHPHRGGAARRVSLGQRGWCWGTYKGVGRTGGPPSEQTSVRDRREWTPAPEGLMPREQLTW